MNDKKKHQARKQSTLKRKLKHWFFRYYLAEIAGIAFAYVFYFLSKFIFNNIIFVSYAASIGETIAYYAVIVFREFWKKEKGKTLEEIKATDSLSIPIKIFHLITEFGPAEALDSFVLRPLFMGIGLHYLGPIYGILAGKLAADVTFYIPVIISYELRNYYYHRRNRK